MSSRPRQIQLVCGLGNPGGEYADTRHNAGFQVVDALAGRWGVSYWKSQAGSEVGVVERDGLRTILAKPQSFMNTSGGPIAKLAGLYDIEPEQILIVHDELDIPEGDVRVKFGGGHAGHNGLRSIIDKLGSRDFSRVRVGIGRPPGQMDPADFVLQQLKGDALEEFRVTVQVAADAAASCVVDGVIAARDRMGAVGSE